MSDSPSEQTSHFELTDTDRHRILADERRRMVVDTLADQTPPIGLEELTTAIAMRETNAEDPSDEDIKRVAISLHHKHLPRLTEAGATRYEPTSNRIEAINVATDLL